MGGEVPRTSSEQLERPIDPGVEIAEVDRPEPGRAELDGQWKAVEPGAHLDHEVHLRRAEPDGRICPTGPVEEQGDTGRVRVVEFERRQTERTSPSEPQRSRTAGRQDAQAEGACEEVVDDREPRMQVLEVVEHERCRDPLFDAVHDGVVDRATAVLADADAAP